jgi:hypothetical protein
MTEIKSAPIIQTPDGYYRRVSHAEKLASTGFGTPEKMEEWTPNLRTDEAVLKIMRDRYTLWFGKEIV